MSTPVEASALSADILAESGLSSEQMQAMRVPARVRFPKPDGSGTIDWQVGAGPPIAQLKEHFLVHAIFTGTQGDKLDDAQPGDLRIYCTPVRETAEPSFLCLVVKDDGRIRTDTMRRATFVEDVAFEWRSMLESREAVEGGEEVPECAACEAKETDDPPTHCARCGALLEEPQDPLSNGPVT